MRVVIDTNVLIAGLLWHGSPHALLTQVRSCALGLVSSPALLVELADVLSRTKFDAVLKRTNTSRERLLAEVRQLTQVLDPLPLPLAQPVCRDPDDDKVLALALAARVELIVSGDRDLLVLQQFEGMPIVDPAQALQRVGVG